MERPMNSCQRYCILRSKFPTRCISGPELNWWPEPWPILSNASPKQIQRGEIKRIKQAWNGVGHGGASILQKLGHKQPLCTRVLAILSISKLHLLPPTRDPRPSGRSLFLDLHTEASYDILLIPSKESTQTSSCLWSTCHFLSDSEGLKHQRTPQASKHLAEGPSKLSLLSGVRFNPITLANERSRE